MITITEVFLAFIVVVIAEAVYIAIVSARTKMLSERLGEAEEKLRVIEEISDWEKMKKMIKEETRRRRKRYIVFRFTSEGRASKEKIWEMIKTAIIRAYGEPFLNKAMIDLVHYDEERRAGILRVEHKYKEQVIGALGLIRERNMVIIPVKTTGTIRKAREYIY